MKSLQIRFMLFFTGLTVLFIIFLSIVLTLAAQYHIHLYELQIKQEDPLSKAVSNPYLLYHLVHALKQTIWVTGLLAMAAAVLVSIALSKRLSKPIVSMTDTAKSMTQGQLSVRVPVKGSDELAELATNLNELAAQLQKQELLRESLTQDVAHELRTPLTTLQSHIEALIDGVWEPTTQHLHSCLEEVIRLKSLVQDLESLTWAASDALALELKPIHLSKLLQNTCQLNQANFENKQLHLQCEIPEGIYINGQKDKMIQIVQNLLSNAHRYTPANGTVIVRLKTEDGQAVLQVQDNGNGIPAEDLPFVFERFYRVEKSRSRSRGGSGLGLPIVKKLVEAHAGTVSLTSTWKVGTCVTLSFPILRSSQEEHQMKTASHFKRS